MAVACVNREINGFCAAIEPGCAGKRLGLEEITRGGNYARLTACGTVDILGVMQKQRLKFRFLSRICG